MPATTNAALQEWCAKCSKVASKHHRSFTGVLYCYALGECFPEYNQRGYLSKLKDSRLRFTPGGTSIIRRNAEKDPSYAPYCGRCDGLQRMRKIEPFLWDHHCGAVHDERVPTCDICGASGKLAVQGLFRNIVGEWICVGPHATASASPATTVAGLDETTQSLAVARLALAGGDEDCTAEMNEVLDLFKLAREEIAAQKERADCATRQLQEQITDKHRILREYEARIIELRTKLSDAEARAERERVDGYRLEEELRLRSQQLREAESTIEGWVEVGARLYAEHAASDARLLRLTEVIIGPTTKASGND